MASYNKVILMGNLTRDPELKIIPNGTSVCEFGMAMNESYTDKNTGEKKDVPCFVDVEVWGNQAEVVEKYFTKGKPIMLEGSLVFQSWETDEGQKRSRLKVRLQRFQFVGRKDDDDISGDSVPGSDVSPPVSGAEDSPGNGDIPF